MKIWAVWQVTGEYDDRSEFILDDTVYPTKALALAAAAARAATRGLAVDPDDSEAWRGRDRRNSMDSEQLSVFALDLVPDTAAHSALERILALAHSEEPHAKAKIARLAAQILDQGLLE